MNYFSRTGAATESLGLQFDEWCNVVFWGGAKGQTVSEHAALDAKAGRWPGCVLCALLSVLVQWRHCAKTLDPTAITPANAYVRAGLCFLFAVGALGNQLIALAICVIYAVLSLLV